MTHVASEMQIPARVFAGFASIGLLLFATATLVSASESRVEYRMVARRGDVAPGVAGATFASVSSDGPLISPAGHVAFFANTTSSSSMSGIWSGRPGEVSLVAREPAQAPGMPAGAIYADLREISGIDSDGSVAFWGYPSGGGVLSSRWGAFTGPPGAVSLLLREDIEVPWVASGVLATGNLSVPRLGGGRAVLSASTTGSTGHGSVGIWQTSASGLQLIMRQGASAPGMPLGAVFDGSNGAPYVPLINGVGDIAFAASVAGGGVSYGSNDRGVWVRTAGGLGLAFRGDSTVSGFGTGVTLRLTELQSFANDGSIAFTGTLRQPSGDALTNSETLWWGKPGDIRLVARVGSPAPGEPAGIVYESISSVNSVIAGEYIGFAARLSGPGVAASNNYAFFIGRRDAVSMVLREGDQVPGMAPGVVFADLTDRFAMNAHGQIAFRATIAGPGITTANDDGIWATDSRGGLVEVARQGTPISVNYTDGTSVSLPVVRLSILADSGGEDGRPTSINPSGQVAFYVYTDPTQTSRQAAIIRADIIEPCIGDFNADGFLDFADFDDFVGAFEGGLASSDITGDGFLDFEDFDAFVAAFEAGC